MDGGGHLTWQGLFGEQATTKIAAIFETESEAASAAVADTIRNASRAAGFTPKTPVIEISGTCAHCKAAA